MTNLIINIPRIIFTLFVGFVLLTIVIHFIQTIINCWNEKWPQKHRFLYIIATAGTIQFPITATITTCIGTINTWEWVLTIMISFLIATPGIIMRNIVAQQ